MRSSEFITEKIVDEEMPVEIADLEGDVSDPVVAATVNALRELIGQGHTEVNPTVITNMVVAATSKPFLLKDLVAITKQSAEVEHYIDSIDPNKVKFSSEILTVKNDKTEQNAGDNRDKTISAMASRARNRS